VGRARACNGTGGWPGQLIRLVELTLPSLIRIPPPQREDTAWAYNKRTSSLLMFGGWANCWLGDLLRLSASAIIGPPYACTGEGAWRGGMETWADCACSVRSTAARLCRPLASALTVGALPRRAPPPSAGITPSSGPVFGESEVLVSGLRFRPGRAQVCFAGDHGRGEATVDAEFVDAATLRCKTPNFETFGAGGASVRVSINGEGWTVDRLGYTYFANTAARHCLAFGPGLLPAAGAYGLPLPFVIQARDTLNERRSGGGDVFAVRVTAVDSTKPVEGATAGVRDLGSGLYDAHYTVPAPGTYQVGPETGGGQYRLCQGGDAQSRRCCECRL
jgi:dynein heavy chain, axonemal